jgi:guanylate cyclase
MNLQTPFHYKRTGSQKTNELKDALEAENEKSKQMQEAMKKVDIEMKRSDELLSQMIPKAVADKVKKGLNPVDTCEVFILFVHKIIQKGVSYL